MSMNKAISSAKPVHVILAPHPDDEVIGMGGTIASLQNRDEQVLVLFFSVVSSIQYKNRARKKVLQATRLGELKRAAQILKYSWQMVYPLRSNRLDITKRSTRQWLDRVEALLTPMRYSIKSLFIPAPSYHQDHNRVYEVGLALSRPSYMPRCMIATYDSHANGWREGFLQANLLVDISRFRTIKERAISAYKSQMRGGYFSSSAILSNSQAQGAHFGCDLVESFHVLRFWLPDHCLTDRLHAVEKTCLPGRMEI